MGTPNPASRPALVDALKPFRGGNDTLWQLAQLSNIEKHRLLLTVGTVYDSVDNGGHIWRMMVTQTPDATGSRDSDPLSLRDYRLCRRGNCFRR